MNIIKSYQLFFETKLVSINNLKTDITDFLQPIVDDDICSFRIIPAYRNYKDGSYSLYKNDPNSVLIGFVREKNSHFTTYDIYEYVKTYLKDKKTTLNVMNLDFKIVHPDFSDRQIYVLFWYKK